MSVSMRSATSYSFMSPASRASFSATRLMITLRGSDTVYTGWPKPITISLLATRRRMSASASSGVS